MSFDTFAVNLSPYAGRTNTPGWTAPIYPFSSDFTVYYEGKIVPLPYTKDLWDYVMNNIFPTVTNEDFIAEKAKTNPTIYERVFSDMVYDFQESVIKGRDDPASDKHIANSHWKRLSHEDRQLLFHAYTRTRFNSSAEAPSGRPTLSNLNHRSTNMRIWMAYLLIKSLEQIQQHTINVGRLATRYAQTAQSVSKEMTHSNYKYIPLVNSYDFSGLSRNQNNAKKLEDLKTFRLLMQKHVDRASSDLSKANSNAELFSSFVSRVFEIDLQMVRSVFL